MNFSLLLPSALTALLALAIPVLIHLSRRSEHKLVDFAAMRWLQAHLRPQRKWQLQERLLLAVRLLLLIALSLWLAQPVLKTNGEKAHWIVVVPGAGIAGIDIPATDKKTQWHWLSPGYPAFETPPDASNVAFSSLLRELDSQLPAGTELTIVLPEKLAGLDGQRIQLSRKVNWAISPGAMKQTAQKQENSPVNLAVRYDLAHRQSLIYFRALQDSWQSEKNKKPLIEFSLLNNNPPNKEQALVWLASGELPAPIVQWVQAGGTLLASHEVEIKGSETAVPVWRDAQNHVVLRTLNWGNGRILQWNAALTPATMPILLDAQFPDELLSILKPKPTAPSLDYAKHQVPEHVNFKWPAKPDTIPAWLIGIILLLFAVERLLATRKNSWAAS